MVYHVIKGKIDPKYSESLIQSLSVPVSLSGDDDIYVNSAQLKRYNVAKEKGRKTFRLKMSKRQLNKNLKSGAGWLSDFWTGFKMPFEYTYKYAIKEPVKFLNKEIVQPIRKELADPDISDAVDAVADTVALVDPSKAAAAQQVKGIKDKIKAKGSGVRRATKKTTKKKGGKGIRAPSGKGIRSA